MRTSRLVGMARLLAACVLSVGNAALLTPGTAKAEELRTPIRLVLELSPSAGVDPARIREAIANELGVGTTSGDAPGGTLLVRQTGGRVLVWFESPDGRKNERSLDVAGDPEAFTRDIALLATNVVRNQAAPFIATELDAPLAPQTAASASSATGVSGTKAASSTAPERPLEACGREGPRLAVGLDVAPYLGVSSARGGREAARVFSLGVVGTLSGGIDGIAIAGAFHLDRYQCGLAVAGGVNYVSGPATGLQLAGALNMNDGGAKGLQIAAVNLAQGPVRGFQIGAANAGGETIGAQIGAFDLAAGSATGAQIGAFNIASGSVTGAQIGAFDLAAGSITGAQIGAIDIAAGPVMGAQIGAINIATKPLMGAQIGAINTAGADSRIVQIGAVNVLPGYVHGIQIGAINIAEDADFAIGAVNVLYKGRFHADAWVHPETGMFFAGVKNGGKHFHSIYGIGVDVTDGRHPVWLALGLGAHLTPTETLFVDLDVMGYMVATIDHAKLDSLQQARAVVGYRFLPQLAVFGGPTFNLLYARDTASPNSGPGYRTRLATTGDGPIETWPGLVLGVEGL